MARLGATGAFDSKGSIDPLREARATGNWNNTPVCIMQYWSMRSGRILVEKRRSGQRRSNSMSVVRV